MSLFEATVTLQNGLETFVVKHTMVGGGGELILVGKGDVPIAAIANGQWLRVDYREIKAGEMQ